ncbi:MAG: ABC transporter permease [Clostridiales bacterium]|nr:ABC transporter permease [Clostridiales bacterium]
MTDYNLGPKSPTFLSLEYKDAVREACSKVSSGKGSFIFPDANGTDVEYEVELKDFYYTVTRIEQTYMLARYKAPTGKNLLGTESSAFDVVTRLMYGGRVSLMVGFVVVLIELIIGVILGGIAGYFSGWVDVIIMRFIELFNCIPFYPLLMIIVAGLDAARVGNDIRILLLMVVLGVLSWPGIARIVRGQILSLREQDFMVATEATGIPVRRRIFRHLIPNVIPLLIVTATMSLGGIIITEATLGFLGLGVKYPAASWGSIINQANDFVVMSQYWWVWIPAGALILLTVLGFNFVGDGLRDAFDPKMKR